MTKPKPASIESIRSTYPSHLRLVRKPPESLERPEAELWAAILGDHKIEEAGKLRILETGLIHLQDWRKARAIVADEGEMISGRFGLRPHPMIEISLMFHRRYLQCMMALGLNLFSK
jgi:hypothetical protein